MRSITAWYSAFKARPRERFRQRGNFAVVVDYVVELSCPISIQPGLIEFIILVPCPSVLPVIPPIDPTSRIARFSEELRAKATAGEKPELLERMKKKLLEINASVMADGHDWHLE
jgi:hypothetical protein